MGISNYFRLRTRMIMLILVTLIPFAAAVTYVDYAHQKLVKRHMVDDARKMALLVAREQDHEVRRIRSFLIAFSRTDEIIEGGDGCVEMLSSLNKEFRGFENIGVIGRDGMLKYSARPFEGPLDLSDRTYFRRAVETRDFAVGEYQVGRVVNKETLNFGYPVIENSGEVSGVLFVAQNVSLLRASLEDSVRGLLPGGTTITLVDFLGTIVSRYPETEGWVGAKVGDKPVISNVLESHEDIVERKGPQDVPRLYMAVPFTSSIDTKGITIILGVPEKAVFGGEAAVFSANLAIFAVGLGLCILLAFKWSDRYIISKVNSLVDTTRKISSGDLSARTGMDYDQGEMGQLAHAVDDMAGSLQAQERTVNEALDFVMAAEAKYRTLVESIPAITYSTEPYEPFNVKYISPQVEGVLGFKR